MLGKREYIAGMPIMSSCSLAISAACHAPPGDGKAALMKVMYGATWRSVDGSEYVGLSSKDVIPLKEGVIYGRKGQTEETSAPADASGGLPSVSLYTGAEIDSNEEA